MLELNRGFYQSFAEPFSQTRQRLQPGVLRALDDLPAEAAVLDLGCGSGGLAAELDRRGHAGAYVGLDSSEELLVLARSRFDRPSWRFEHADLASEAWPARARQGLGGQRQGTGAGETRAIEDSSAGGAQAAKGSQAGAAQPSRMAPDPSAAASTAFQRAFAFAVLHHIPSEALRIRLLRQVHGLLAPAGRFTLSVWNFLASPRLRQRIRPWREAGLAEEEVDPGDYLLDWRHGGHALRYVHHFNEPELAGLAEASGFRVVDGYLSDGERGRLGRYQVWEIAHRG